MNKFSFIKGGKALYCLFLMGFLLPFYPVYSKNGVRNSTTFLQQHQIQGIVTDGTAPLPGVTIAVKGKLNVTAITDYSGQYSLSASPQDTLIVSFIGFKTAVFPISGRTKIAIVLQFDTTTLQEVRVNAGYYSVKESERTGSIARITAKDIENQPVTNVLATMQGRMAGVNITQTTGVPGGGFDIKIRGQNSIRTEGNAPLYIIDGVPYASDPIGYNQTATTYPSVTSPLNSINPDAIESIEVLKDADATAIYGSRGANGVVLITTKKGKAGQTTFTVNASTGAGRVTRFMDLMHTEQYLAMRRQAFVNDGLTSYGATDYDINGTWDQNRYTDWQKELLGGTTLLQDFQGTVSGGSQRTQFLLSGNYHQETTVFPGDFVYKKGGAQVNINHRSEDDRFRIAFSGGYTAQDNNLPAFDLTYDARALAPNAPALYDANGELNWEDGTWDNPLRNLNAQFLSRTKDLVANTVLSYVLLPQLTLKSSFGYTDLNTVETRTSPSTIYNPAYGITSDRSTIYVNHTHRSSWIAEPQLNWKKETGRGALDVLLGATFQHQTTEKLYESGSGFSSNSLIYNLAAAKFPKVLLDESTQYRYQAFFGRINYAYASRYILNLTARRDGSSRFGPGNQFATFGAVGAAWLFHQEGLFAALPWLSFGKIRSSLGTTGNDQIGDYMFLNTYTTASANYSNAVGMQPTRLFNANFGWETNKKTEAALELGFFQDRIFATAAWYSNRSSNQLVGVPLPGTTGFSVLQSNLDATVENTGWELSLRTVNLNTAHFNWTTSLNLTFARNRLIEFPGLANSAYSQKYRIGQPLNILLLYTFKGVNDQTGVYEFEDLNQDGRITAPEDQQTIADLNPKYYGGLHNELRYKNWKLDFLFQFVKQDNILYPMGFAGQMANQPLTAGDSWVSAGDPASYQRYTTGVNSSVVQGDNLFNKSTASITDASFIRLKNIALSYDVPLQLNHTRCTVLLQSQNLLTFTRCKGGDPEFTFTGYLPPLKVITAGVQLTF
ncbi:SusC/RagA family TonB-linked outer membrane protein [Flavobacterium limi]|nr:SusC/RagA family TonB-linked outer membrane protein [Flavobacterium limi]